MRQHVYLLCLLALTLTSCAGLPKPQLALDIRNSYRIAEVVTDVPSNAKIWWGDAEREYAATLGEGRLERVILNDDGTDAIGSGKGKSHEEIAKTPE